MFSKCRYFLSIIEQLWLPLPEKKEKVLGVVIRQSLKGTILNLIGVALGAIIQLFVVTEFLLPETLGLTKVFYEASHLCSCFALLGVSAAGMRFFPFFRNKENNNNGFFFYYMMIPVVGSILISTLYILCKGPIDTFFSRESPEFSDYFYLVIPLMIILAFWSALENYSNINMRIAFPKGIREIVLRLLLLVCYLLFARKILSLDGLMNSMVAAYGLCMLMVLVYVSRIAPVSLKHDSSFLTPELKRNYFRYTGFLLLSVVSVNIMAQLDMFMLSSVKGMYEAGVYTIALYIASVSDMPTRSISAISTPLAADALKNGDFVKANDLYKQVSIHQFMASSMILLFIWINMDNIFSIIPNGELYSQGKYAILFLGLSRVLYGTVNFGNIMIQFSKYYYWTLTMSVVLTVLTIFTNLLFIPLFGLSGAALATLLTSILSYSFQQYIVQRKIHGNPFTLKTLVMLMVLALLLGMNMLIPSMTSVSPWLDAIVRSGITAAAGGLLVYWFRISEPVCRIIDKILKRAA